ncbi:MAG: hypothetical protein ABSF98_25235 [Bryobacteraceae bacterium]
MSRLAFRIVLPTVMLAVLFYTLRAAERERRSWIMLHENAHQKAVTNNDVESVPFVLPFRYSARILDAILFQWPAFAIAGIIAPVPPPPYTERQSVVRTRLSYVALGLAVGLYWYLFAAWIDRRLIQRKEPTHHKVVRIIFTVVFVLTVLFFVLFLGKELVGGWPEGPQGAYGVTAWLALASIILMIEVKGFRRLPVSTGSRTESPPPPRSSAEEPPGRRSMREGQ